MAKKAAAAALPPEIADEPATDEVSLIRSLHQELAEEAEPEGEEPPAEEADEEPSNEDEKPEPAKEKPVAKPTAADLENERLRADNAAMLARLDRVEALLKEQVKPAAEPLPDFDDMDATQREAYVLGREQKAREQVSKEAEAAEMRALYKAEKRTHPDYHKLVDKWQTVIESRPDMMKKMHSPEGRENPFAMAYDLAAELEEQETASNAGEEDDQVAAREQLRGPAPTRERVRTPGDGRTAVASEAADLEKMFGKPIDKQKFAKHRTFGEQLRTQRRARR